jgi:hypothetical protein
MRHRHDATTQSPSIQPRLPQYQLSAEEEVDADALLVTATLYETSP